MEKVDNFSVQPVNIIAKNGRKKEKIVTIFLLTRGVVFVSEKDVRQRENECVVSSLDREEKNKR